MTPEGIKRESEVDRDASLTPQTGKKLDRMIIGVMAIVIVFLLVDRFFLQDRAPRSQPAAESVTASEMEPITWPEFSDIHPFAPVDQAAGYPFAWFFTMLTSARVSFAVGDAVLADLAAGYTYLPERDAAVLRAWAQARYAP